MNCFIMHVIMGTNKSVKNHILNLKEVFMMKKIISFLIFTSFLLSSSSLADGAYDLSTYSINELEAIYSIASNEAFGCVKVPSGLYIVGKDLPSGVYTVLKNSETPGNTQDDFSHVAIFNSIDDYKKDPNNIFNEGSYAIASCNTMWNGLSCELTNGMVLVVYLGIAGITKADNDLFSIFGDSKSTEDDEKADSFSSVNTEAMYAFLKESTKNGELKLKSFDWPEITVEQFHLSEAYIAKKNFTKEEALYALQNELPNYFSDIYSLSRSGNSGLFRINRGTVSYYNGKYTPTYPTDVRGYTIEADKQGNYYGILDQLAGNSVIYSHNGRYASTFSFDPMGGSYSLKRKPEPILIDLKTGEIIAMGIFADGQDGTDPGYITTGCFSLDDKYFYFNVLKTGKETRTNTLYRYNIETETSEECCSIPLILITVNMYETNDNHLISVGLNNDQGTEWLDISQTDDNWIVSTKPFSPESTNYWVTSGFLYSAETNFGIVAGSTSYWDIWFMKLFNLSSTESTESTIAIVNSNNEFVSLTEEEFIYQMDTSRGRFTDYGGIQRIKNIALSPDGHFALLLVGGKQLKPILVDLETKETCTISGIGETLKGAPLGPSIEWNGDKLILFTDQNKHQVYQLDY